VLFPLPSNAASPLRWRISLVNDVSSHLLTDSNKSPCYYIFSNTSPRLGKLFVIPLSATSKANSITAAYNNKIFIDVVLQVPKMIINFLTIQTKKNTTNYAMGGR